MEIDYKKAYEDLLARTIQLHTEYGLEQYGLSEERSSEIVSHLTGLPDDVLKKLRNDRDEVLRSRVKLPFVVAAIQSGADPQTAYRIISPEDYEKISKSFH